MISINNIEKFDFESLPIDSFWNVGNGKEFKMHRIHAYPAKFPAFITTKAIEFAKNEGYQINTIADIFCGCGTTAFEAKRNNIDFWGCDINPVATLIAKVKSKKYNNSRLEKYFLDIVCYYKNKPIQDKYQEANSRLKYWYVESQYNNLAHLKQAIENVIPSKSIYKPFFLCAFSNILKPTSLWLTKSIKPQVDPHKNLVDVEQCFREQYKLMSQANLELQNVSQAKTTIVTGDILHAIDDGPTVDMVITSPPYVTSYEYADLHQLSSLWLEFTNDYRNLREGSIGSLYHDYNFKREWKRLNETGNKIVSLLLDQEKSKASSVAKYFLDMQKVACKVYEKTTSKGLALFVIGNTEYKNVRIDNAKHLAESLLNAGFKKIFATKRKISNKILTPYRDEKGKFTTNSSGKKVYSEEFIIIGEK